MTKPTPEARQNYRASLELFLEPITIKRTNQSMKSRILIALAGVVILFSACIPSVNPFYTAKDVAYDPHLIGTWAEPGKEDSSWCFQADGTNAYTLTVTEDNEKSARFKAVLFKLNGKTYLDTMPTKIELKDNQPSMVEMSLIRGHLLVRVREIEPKLKLDCFDWDWLKKYLQEHPKALAHRGTGDEDDPFVLTAEPRELQNFVLKHLKDGELFKVDQAEDGWVRLTNAPSASPAPAK